MADVDMEPEAVDLLTPRDTDVVIVIEDSPPVSPETKDRLPQRRPVPVLKVRHRVNKGLQCSQASDATHTLHTRQVASLTGF